MTAAPAGAVGAVVSALAAAALSAAAPAIPAGPPPAAAGPGAGHAAPRDAAAVDAERHRPRALPFRVGEEARYRVSASLGSAPLRPVGTARLAVEARETVGGREAFRAVREMEAAVPLVYSVDDRQVSWFVADPFRSLRFEEHLRQGDHRRDRRYRLDQEAGSYTRWDRSGEGGWRRSEEATDVPMPADAMDEVAFLYFVRTLPLEVGTTRRFYRLFEADDNPVVLEVLRRGTARVPAGTFETVVVRPVFRSDGLFSRESRAEVHLTDDDRRLVVRIESRMKAGRVDLSLEGYRPGGEE